MNRLALLTLLFTFGLCHRHLNLAPPLIRSDVPLIASQRAELPQSFGQYDFIGNLDLENLTVTLPLYEAKSEGGDESLWYIITDVSDIGLSERYRLNYAPQLRFTSGDLIRSGSLSLEQGKQILNVGGGFVDFSQERSLGEFDNSTGLPQSATAGSQGDEQYTPLLQIEGSTIVYNAPYIATGSAEDLNQYCQEAPGDDAYQFLHDSVARICPQQRSITLKLFPTFSMGRLVLTLPVSSSDQNIAAISFATYVPLLGDLSIAPETEESAEQPEVNHFHFDVESDISSEEALLRISQINNALPSGFSPLEAVYITSNGFTNADLEQGNETAQSLQTHPLRQGLGNIGDEGFIFPVLGGLPYFSDHYSPLWEVYLLEWSQTAIDNGFRTFVKDEVEVLNNVYKNLLTSAQLDASEEGVQFQASNIVLNFPVIARLW